MPDFKTYNSTVDLNALTAGITSAIGQINRQPLLKLMSLVELSLLVIKITHKSKIPQMITFHALKNVFLSRHLLTIKCCFP